MEQVYDNAVTTNKKQKKRNEINDFHNSIKKKLIQKFAFKTETLFDFCCGRGGDISKFMYSEINQCILCDISSESIKEAQERYELCYKYMAKKTRFQFQVCDLRKEIILPQQADVITCMFALHYFFETKAICCQFFKNVSINLKKDGIFIGCIPDGKKILELLKERKKFKNEHIKIKSEFDSKECFGSKYGFFLKDSILEDFESKEYLVFENVMITMGSKNLLIPLLNYELDGLIEKNNKLFKHFIPNLSTKQANETSAINCVFAFQKI